jgi:hypothetical protein
VLSLIVAAPIGPAAAFAITAENATAPAAVMIQYRDLILHLRRLYRQSGHQDDSSSELQISGLAGKWGAAVHDAILITEQLRSLVGSVPGPWHWTARRAYPLITTISQIF